MSDTTNDREAVFTYFMNCGAKVWLSTAAVFDGLVNHNYVVVHDAPPKVVREVVGNFTMVSLTADGLLIPLTARSKD